MVLLTMNSERKTPVDNLDTLFRFTGKELDAETGNYYYGARYLDPRTSRWLSTDPAIGEYVPGAPVNDEARKRNGNLPGMGGVFNVVNFHLYHYAGNNPVKYVDPDGKYVINNVAQGVNSAKDYALQKSTLQNNTNRYFGGGYIGGFAFKLGDSNHPSIASSTWSSVMPDFLQNEPSGIVLEKGLNTHIGAAISAKNDSLSETKGKITASAKKIGNDRFEVNIKVEIDGKQSKTGTIAFAGGNEIMTDGVIDQKKVNKIANDTINIVRNTDPRLQNIDVN